MGVAPHPTWPTGHVGWFYSEPAVFEGGATIFLAEGLQRNERIVFVADDPGVRRWPGALVEEGLLVLVGLDELYGPLRAGGLDAQRGVFERALADALRDGLGGIRFVADNTRMVLEDLPRWIEWERVADVFMAFQPMTGLCCFDRSRLSLDDLHVMLELHPRAVTAT